MEETEHLSEPEFDMAWMLELSDAVFEVLAISLRLRKEGIQIKKKKLKPPGTNKKQQL